MRELASGMRQLAGNRKRYRRAYAAPLAELISGRAEYRTSKEINPCRPQQQTQDVIGGSQVGREASWS